jgi:uncharacterized protein (DUF2267 family)
VASQLPDELKELLLSRGDTDIYEVQEFYRRIGARADTNYNDAAKRAKAVIGVLQEAISAGEVQDMIESLPEQYAKIFDGDQSGPGFPSLDRS